MMIIRKEEKEKVLFMADIRDVEKLRDYLFRKADVDMNLIKNPYEKVRVRTYRDCFEMLLACKRVDIGTLLVQNPEDASIVSVFDNAGIE